MTFFFFNVLVQYEPLNCFYQEIHSFQNNQGWVIHTMWCRFFQPMILQAFHMPILLMLLFVVRKKISFELKKKDKDFNSMAEMTLVLLFGNLNVKV